MSSTLKQNDVILIMDSFKEKHTNVCCAYTLINERKYVEFNVYLKEKKSLIKNTCF